MSARIDPAEAGGINVVAFLDMLAWSEIGPALLSVSDDGYNVLQGATANHPYLFDDYSTFPVRPLTAIHTSTAAGRYQLLARYYQPYAQMLVLTDFSPVSQDKIAIQQIRECRALPLIEAGNINAAVQKVAHIWASLPGANYGQRENRMSDLIAAYTNAGGSLA